MIQKSLLFLALTLTFVGYLEAQVTLDEHFGDQGIVVTPNTMSIDKTITTTDNKIISFGNFKPGTSSYKTVVAKYNEDGSLDTSFGDNGIRYDTDTESISSYVIAIDTLPDGSILVGGYYHYNYVDIGGVFYSVDSAFITKYKGNGSLDTSFDNTGISKYSFGSRSANVNAIVATNDNMVVGFNGDENSSGVVMLNADGSIDHSWANNGFIHFQKEKLLLYGIAQGTDGTFFCYGSNFKGLNSFGESYGDIVVMKFLSNGDPDNNFGNNGLFVIDQADQTKSQEFCTKLELTSNGGFILGGYSFLGYQMLVKVNANGTPDSSFADNGILDHEYAYADFTILDNQHIIIGGSKSLGSFNYGFSITQFTPGGRLDSSFNNQGFFDIDISDNHDYLQAITVQNNGKIVLSGSAKLINNEATFTLVRVENTSSSVLTLPSSGFEFDIHPNPSSGIFNLDCFTTSHGVIEVTVMDLSGKNVYHHNSMISGNYKHEINLDHVASGIYFLQLELNGKKEIFKLSKQ